MSHDKESPKPKTIGSFSKKVIESILFNSRWLLIVFYLGLMVALAIYMYVDMKEIYHFAKGYKGVDKELAMITLLELVDIAMIANLVKMIITGSYNSFVAKDHGFTGENATSGILKVKMATSLIGVSSIHLLTTFINASKIDWDTLSKQLWLHGTFLIGALILAVVDYLHEKSAPEGSH